MAQYIKLVEEDNSLAMLVTIFQEKRWKEVSREMHPDVKGIKKTAKQCRERWFNVLKPRAKNHSPFQDDRELLLFEKYELYPREWSKIAKELGGTTDNYVKNHYYSVIRKELRNLWKHNDHKTPDPYCILTNELTIDYIDKILRDFNIEIDQLINKNIKTLIKNKRKHNASLDSENKNLNTNAILNNSFPGIPNSEELTKKAKNSNIIQHQATKDNENGIEMGSTNSNYNGILSKKRIMNSKDRDENPDDINSKNFKKKFHSFLDNHPEIVDKPTFLPLVNIQKQNECSEIYSKKMDYSRQQENFFSPLNPALFSNPKTSLYKSFYNDPLNIPSDKGFLLNEQLFSNPFMQMNCCPSLIREVSYCQFSHDIHFPFNQYNYYKNS